MTKQIIFFANTKVLVEQQKARIEEYLPKMDPSFYSQNQIFTHAMHGEVSDSRINRFEKCTKSLCLFLYG